MSRHFFDCVAGRLALPNSQTTRHGNEFSDAWEEAWERGEAWNGVAALRDALGFDFVEGLLKKVIDRFREKRKPATDQSMIASQNLSHLKRGSLAIED